MTNRDAIKLLKKARAELDVTQEKLASVLGLSTRTYTRLEQGTYEIKDLHLLALDQLVHLKKLGEKL